MRTYSGMENAVKQKHAVICHTDAAQCALPKPVSTTNQQNLCSIEFKFTIKTTNDNMYIEIACAAASQN